MRFTGCWRTSHRPSVRMASNKLLLSILTNSRPALLTCPRRQSPKPISILVFQLVGCFKRISARGTAPLRRVQAQIRHKRCPLRAALELLKTNDGQEKLPLCLSTGTRLGRILSQQIEESDRYSNSASRSRFWNRMTS